MKSSKGRLDKLKKAFLVERAPQPLAILPRVTTTPARRPFPPKYGIQLLTWITEEADEQLQMGVRPAQVTITKRDLMYLQHLLRWLPARPTTGPWA